MAKFKCVTITLAAFFILGSVSFAASSFIESISKIRKADGYTFKINYQTRDEWTDGIVFKVFCSFSKGVKLSFTSAGYSNIKKGWHDTEIFIPKVYRDRYGYITDYRTEMYCKGMLVSLKGM